jgi:ABC-type microcin C transport system permease subunit YejE
MTHPWMLCHGGKVVAMKYDLNNTVLLNWFLCNSIVTICFGLFLAMICLFPACSPSLAELFSRGSLDLMLPYIIFTLIVTSLVSISCFYDSLS